MTTLQNFATLPFIKALKAFFEDLHIPINYLSDLPASPSAIFGDAYNTQNIAHALIDDIFVLGTVDDTAFTETKNITENDIKNADYDFILIIGITLKTPSLLGRQPLLRAGEGFPTRSQLAELTRLANKIFNTNQKGNPVTVVFRYADCISFSNVERISRNESDFREGEKLRKVSSLKDIKLTNTHAAHQRILLELAKPAAFASFEGLHEHWRKVFDTKELNKSFFKKIANWYFWAIAQAKFPYQYLRNDEKHAAKTDDELQNLANQKSLIRFITRIVFVWFLKEKKLVPESLFDEVFLKKTLQNFDEDSTDYYNAILQNLFFATLNRTKDQRAFATDEGFLKNKSNFDVNSLYRYEKMFKNANPEQIMGIFEDIPFLNGGLFDSLDNKENALLMDGFSRSPKRQAIMPDKLFFATKIDDFDQKLNEIYYTKSKKYELKGLFTIFDEYKFTVEENTPLEIDVALDPYLLGEIFENLLAYYNPETGTTARKGSGSFYTPQEIVNYMVDESLKAYLNQQLSINNEQLSIIEELFSNAPNFDYTGSKMGLVKALSEIKILDPACGSGAFPMGVLQRMVQLLAKLDPDNSLWREIQKEKIIGKKIAELEADKQTIAGLSDAEVRNRAIAAVEDRIHDIEEIFNNQYNFDDYARKLFIIQNCIYGVDIQDVAIQISKLRFFLSLIIDQKNEAIKPLPNLETKFVIANTLIGLEKPKAQTGNVFTNDIELEIEELGDKLKKLRNQYFELRNRKEKQILQTTDRQLRATIAQKLQNIGYDAKNAGKIAAWDIYDQNATADWFDINWMFGITDGFDVVIGNPPYVKVQNIEKEHIEYFKKNFQSSKGKYDIYVLFIELALKKLIKENGLVVYINPHRFMTAEYGQDLRNYLVEKKSISKIIVFGVEQIFESASTYTGIFIFSKKSKQVQFCEVNNIGDMTNLKFKEFYFEQLTDTWNFNDNNEILAKITSHKSAKDIFAGIYQGLISMGDDIHILKGEIIDDFFIGFSKALNKDVRIEKELMKPLLKGEDIQRYSDLHAKFYVFYPHFQNNLGKTLPISIEKLMNNFPLGYSYISNFKDDLITKKNKYKTNPNYWYSLHRSREMSIFHSEKLITPQLQNKPSFVIDNNCFYPDAGGYMLVKKDNDVNNIKFYLSIFNSKLFYHFITQTSTPYNNNYYYFKTNYIEPFSIPQLSPESQQPFITLVEKILLAKKGEQTLQVLETCKVLEAEIDKLVYQLYELTADEIAIVEGR